MVFCIHHPKYQDFTTQHMIQKLWMWLFFTVCDCMFYYQNSFCGGSVAQIQHDLIKQGDATEKDDFPHRFPIEIIQFDLVSLQEWHSHGLEPTFSYNYNSVTCFFWHPSSPHPGAVFTGVRRHVRVEGSASGARHRPRRRRGQLLRHRKVKYILKCGINSWVQWTREAEHNQKCKAISGQIFPRGPVFVFYYLE